MSFRDMDPEKRREVARKGGRASHANGHAHEFTEGSQEAKEAGRKGGLATGKKFREKRGSDGGQ